MKKNLMKKLVLGITVLAIGSTNVYAVSFSGYVLPSLQRNKQTRVHYKKDTKNFVSMKITALTNTGRVNAWVTTEGGKQITDDYKYEKNQSHKMKFKNACYAHVGQDVRVVMENAEWRNVENAFVSGEIHFH